MNQLYEDVKREGYDVDEQTVTINKEYFKHQLKQCKCVVCQCGTCQCNPPKFHFPQKYKHPKRRSITPNLFNLTLNQNYYETSQSSYREMNQYPAQFQTSNNTFYKDHHLPATSRSISITNHLSNEPFEGNTRYNESYKWVQIPKILFKRPVEKHTGPIKLNIRDTQYQRTFINHPIQKEDRYESGLNIQQLQGQTFRRLQASFDIGSIYKSAFKQHVVTERSNTCKKRRLEDLQSINQFQLPFEAKSQSSRAYNNKRIVLCPAKFVK